MTNGSPYDAILFDFDGVLIDTEPVHFDCWRRVLEPHGVFLDWETYRDHCIGVADYKMLEFLGRQAVPPVETERLWAEYPHKNRIFVARMIKNPVVPAETRTLLDELSPIPLAIVSSSGRGEIEPILEASQLAHHFRLTIFSDDVTRLKPDPEPYRIAAARLGARHPLVVEDSDAGAASGHAAGFDVVRVDRAENTAGLVRERLHPAR